MMMGSTFFRALVAAAFASISFAASQAFSAPTVAQALELTPLQKGVDYDQPTPEEAEKCTLKSMEAAESTGWIVLDSGGRTLRRFLDSNGDNKIDLWCYYKSGIEVYRDVDSDFNERADQCRWLATAGTRWGIDRDEDGKIDQWKRISAEEVTEEVVAAIRTRDAGRYERLLPSDEELKSMGLGDKQLEDLMQRAATARAGFVRFTNSQKVVSPKTNWLQFGASRPGILPKVRRDRRKTSSSTITSPQLLKPKVSMANSMWEVWCWPGTRGAPSIYRQVTRATASSMRHWRKSEKQKCRPGRASAQNSRTCLRIWNVSTKHSCPPRRPIATNCIRNAPIYWKN